jgi:hypothetical protein
MTNKTKTQDAKTSGNFWQTHNITEQVGVYSDKLDLDCFCTGGNCDYIVKSLSEDNETTAVLVATHGDGSPETLTEPCFVSIKLNSEWTRSVEIKFATTREAMQFMARLTDVHCWNIDQALAS